MNSLTLTLPKLLGFVETTELFLGIQDKARQYTTIGQTDASDRLVNGGENLDRQALLYYISQTKDLSDEYDQLVWVLSQSESELDLDDTFYEAMKARESSS